MNKVETDEPLILVNDPYLRLGPCCDDDAVRAVVTEQWKMMVETTERIGTRRALTNTFFLTLHTAVFTAVGIFWEHRPKGIRPVWLGLPLGGVLVTCLIWWTLVRSYRLLSDAKFKVVHELETMLPTRPFTAEWSLIEARGGRQRYWKLTQLEQAVPIVFAAMYVAATVLALTTAN